MSQNSLKSIPGFGINKPSDWKKVTEFLGFSYCSNSNLLQKYFYGPIQLHYQIVTHSDSLPSPILAACSPPHKAPTTAYR